MAFEQFKTQVLLLHSEQSTLDSLKAGFDDQYELHCATSGTEALHTLGVTPIHVIVSAHDLPGMSGLDALREAKKRSPETITILMAGAQADDGLEAVVGDQEIFQIVRGEVNPEKLRLLVDNATKTARLAELSESANDTSADADESGEHIVMETGNNGSFLISDGTGKVPVLKPGAVSSVPTANSQQVEVLVLTQDDEFLGAVRESALGMHKVHHAAEPAQAEDFARNFPVGVFVTDVAQAGSEIEATIQRLRTHQHRLVAVVAGRRDDGEMLMDLINRGQVYRFLLKPVSPGRSRLAIEASIKHHLEGSEQAFKPRPAGSGGRAPQTPDGRGASPQFVAADGSGALDDPFDEPNSFTETMTGIAISVGKSISNAAGSFKSSKKDDASDKIDDKIDDRSAEKEDIPELVVPTLSTPAGAAPELSRTGTSLTNRSAPEPPPVDDVKPGLPSLARADRASGSSSKVKLLAVAVVVVLAAALGVVLMGGNEEPVVTARVPASSTPIIPAPVEAPGEEIPTVNPEPAAAVSTTEASPPAVTPENEAAQVTGVEAEPAAVAPVAEAVDNAIDASAERPVEEASLATTVVEPNAATTVTAAAPTPALPTDTPDPTTAPVADLQTGVANPGTDAEITTAQVETDPVVADLLARAQQAREAGNLYAPPGDNAVELLLAAQEASPDNPEVSTELDTLIDDVFGVAETAVLENRAAAADQALRAIDLASPNNPRLNFLRTQLAQQQLRAALDDARLAVRESRFEDAGRMITLAEEIAGGQTADTASLAEELAAARNNQRLTEVLTVAGERLSADQLLMPANDNALYYFELASSIDADSTAAQQGLLAVAGKLVLKARTAIDAGELGEAESLLASARSLDPDSQELVAADNALNAARTAAAAPPAADTAAERPPTATATAADAAAAAPAAAPAEAPASEPAAAEIVAINSLQRVTYVPPKYPRIAQRRDISGHVDIVFTVTTTGEVANVEVTASEPGDVFDEAAIEAVEQWEFEPVVENGTPTEKRAAVRMSFNLQ